MRQKISDDHLPLRCEMTLLGPRSGSLRDLRGRLHRLARRRRRGARQRRRAAGGGGDRAEHRGRRDGGLSSWLDA